MRVGRATNHNKVEIKKKSVAANEINKSLPTPLQEVHDAIKYVCHSIGCEEREQKMVHWQAYLIDLGILPLPDHLMRQQC